MAFQTPTYDFGSRQNRLTQNKGLQDSAQNYGRFLSQERFRRGLDDGQRQFQKRFPQVGRSFNARGLYNSGLRKQGQQEEAQDFQRQTDRYRFDQTANEFQFDNAQAARDAAYQDELLQLYAQMQQQRAAGYDPYAAVKGIL